MTRLTVILLVLLGSGTSSVSAQRTNEREIIVEGMDYLLRKLGPEMVIGSRTDAALDSMIAGLSTRLTERGFRVADPLEKLRCPGILQYFSGPEKYALFHMPRISGDSAKLQLGWMYSAPGATRTIHMMQLIHLAKVNDRWTVVREEGEHFVHSGFVNCREG